MRVIDHLLKAVRDAAVFNPEVQVSVHSVFGAYRVRSFSANYTRQQGGSVVQWGLNRRTGFSDE